MSALPLLDDACAGIPHTKRAMFGGHGFFAANGGMFAAVVDEDRIALKLPDADDYARFLGAGAKPWVYQERMAMAKWAVIPDALYDEPAQLAAWARTAAQTAEPKKARGKAGAKAKAPAKRAAAKRPAKGPTKAAKPRSGKRRR